MRDVRARFAGMVSELRAHPSIEVISAVIAPPATPADMEAARNLARGALPAGATEFFAELNGFQLEWRHTVADVSHGDLSDHGVVNILPVTEIFGDWRGVTWFGEPDDEFRGVKPFDMFVPEACAAFVQAEGEPPKDSVAYHYFGEELLDTGYTFDDYLTRLLASRGFWYWIRTLCPGQQARAEVTAFRRAMPRLFADYDDNLFQPLDC